MSLGDISALCIRQSQSTGIVALVIGADSVGVDCIARLLQELPARGLVQVASRFVLPREYPDYCRAVKSVQNESKEGGYKAYVQVYWVVEVRNDLEASCVAESNRFVCEVLERLGPSGAACVHGYFVDVGGHAGAIKPELDRLPLDSFDVVGPECTYDEAICEVVDRILGVLVTMGEGQLPLGLPPLGLSGEIGDMLLWLLSQFDEHMDKIAAFKNNVGEFIVSVLHPSFGLADKALLANRLHLQVDQALRDFNRGPSWVNGVLAARDVLSMRDAVDGAIRRNETRRKSALRRLAYLRAEPSEGTLALEECEQELVRCSGTDAALRALQLQIDVELSRCGVLLRWMARIQDVLRDARRKERQHVWGADADLDLRARRLDIAEAYKTYMDMLLRYEHAWLDGGYTEAAAFLRDYIDALPLSNMDSMVESSTYETCVDTKEESGFDALGAAGMEPCLNVPACSIQSFDALGTAETDPVEGDWMRTAECYVEGFPGGME